MFVKNGKCKVVLIINVVEISLIIEGICIVVDSGKCCVVSFNLKMGVIEFVM